MLPLTDFAVHGGGFPLTLEGLGCIGALTVSGIPQREDHCIVSDALAEFLNVDLKGCRLQDASDG